METTHTSTSGTKTPVAHIGSTALLPDSELHFESVLNAFGRLQQTLLRARVVTYICNCGSDAEHVLYY